MPALSIGETLPTFRHTRDSSYHVGSLEKNPHCSKSLLSVYMNDPRDWRADQHKTIDHISGIPPFSPGPSQPTFSN